MPENDATSIPAMPLTVEGSWVMHQMFRFDRARWNSVDAPQQRTHLQEFEETLKRWEGAEEFQSAAFLLLGKGDLMVVHFRKNLEDLYVAQQETCRFALMGFMQPVHSYTSVVELGLYESTVKTYQSLREKGLEPNTAEWNAAVADTLARQKEAMAPRLYPKFPPSKYICFYPMDRLRGEDKNWYQVSIQERARMMHEHGLIGRRYAEHVRQIITGSIGFDDWEWGVDLFANDPLVFKKLIYEMRFDEVSAVYAKFGVFYLGLRCTAESFTDSMLGS